VKSLDWHLVVAVPALAGAMAFAPARAAAPPVTIAYQPEPGNEDAPIVWLGREDDKVVPYTSEPKASWWRRIFSGWFGALSPEELL
jgi:hypothetical protein